jgi:RimJ/RimL family protein N-acetyltransferase
MRIEQLYPDEYVSEDLTLKPFNFTDGRQFAAAANASYDQLREWFPWARPGLTVGEAEGICEKFEYDYRDGKAWVFGIWDDDTLLGAGGFYPTDEEYKFTADFWITTPLTFKGHATRALEAMLEWGFRQWSLDSITLKCPVDVPASAKVCEKIGLVPAETVPGAVKDVHGTPRDAVVFVVDKQDWKDTF